MNKRAILPLILSAFFGLSLTGCASYFKRKECEKTNWYQHGYDVAMAGKRLDADDHIKQCQKAEAKISFTEMDTGFKAGMGRYCTTDNVFAVGKAGKPFSYDMCDGESMAKMKGRYMQGLRVFCTPNNGYRFGSTGGVYENVCPSESEDGFMVEYRKGRKVWLAATIQEKEREVSRLNGEILSLEGRRVALSAQAAQLSVQTTIHTEQVFDASTGTYKQQTTQGPDPSAQARSQQLNNEASSLNYEISRNRTKVQSLNDELSKMRTEMAAL